MGLLFVASVLHIVTMKCSILGNGHHQYEIIRTYYFSSVLWPSNPHPPQNKELWYRSAIYSLLDDVAFMVSDSENKAHFRIKYKNSPPRHKNHNTAPYKYIATACTLLLCPQFEHRLSGSRLHVRWRIVKIRSPVRVFVWQTKFVWPLGQFPLSNSVIKRTLENNFMGTHRPGAKDIYPFMRSFGTWSYVNA